MFKNIGVIVLMMGMMLLSGCFKHKEKYRPVLNPHPKYFVTIKGNIQPHMPYPVALFFRATYSANNPACEETTNWLEGIKGMPAKNHYYYIKPNKQGNYKIHIPIDKYVLGHCQWKIAEINVAFTKPSTIKGQPQNAKFGDMIRFGNKNSHYETPILPDNKINTLIWNPNGFVASKGGDLSGWYVDHVFRNVNYEYTQNIKAESKSINI